LPFRLLLTIAYFLCLAYHTQAQDSTSNKKGGYSKSKVAADNLKKSLDGDDEEQTARQYEKLSKELANKGEYAKAENYMKKALEIYARLNKKKDVAQVSRGLAKIQESQNKIAPAIKNYEKAAEISKDKPNVTANYNDANRLRNSQNSIAQMNYAESNASLFEKEGRNEEAADAYQQLAEQQLQQKNTVDAISSYKKAIAITTQPEEERKIRKEMAKVYAADNQVEKAIAINKDMLQKAKKEKDVPQQIDQMIDLASLLKQNNQSADQETLLIEAYRLALHAGTTLKAKDALTALVKHYKEQNKTQQSIAAYEVFINSLDSMLKTDSSLIDAKLFELTEGRIQELEKEKALQQELMNRKNTLNYVLIGSVLAMVLLLLFIIKSWRAIKIKNKKIALQSLRREMNPHFIFNSLNSVNQYIAENNELEANKYLTSYSGLMRNIMENSNKDFVRLSVELEQLKKYLDLEHLRFNDKFDYHIAIDETLDADATVIPNMLIQPHLENAIWHGLRYKEEKGKLSLSFALSEKKLSIRIEDDGIGLAKSKELKTQNQKAHQSRGITNTTERISLLNDLYKTNIVMSMSEVATGGTLITIQLPLMEKL